MKHMTNIRPSLLPTAFALVAFACVDGLPTFAAEQDESKFGKPVLVESKRIWDKAPHNAFTDLLRFNNRWYCVFREGKGHVSHDGALRVITSVDGDKWKSIALIKSPT